MRKTLYIFIILSNWSYTVFSQIPSLQWAKSIEGNRLDLVTAIKADNFGKFYVLGHFYSDTIIFGNTVLKTNGRSDIFFIKCNSKGQIVWAKGIGGSEQDVPTSLTIDSFGNIFITGYFHSKTISFDSVTFANTKPGNAASDIFIVKYNPLGNVVWGQSAGGTGNDQALGIALDCYGNTYITGYSASTSITFGSINVKNYGIFIVKCDFSGNALWLKSIGGNRDDYGKSIVADCDGNTYITGYFQSDTLSFDSIKLIKSKGYDIYVVKYNPYGNAVWARSVVGNRSDYGESIAIDQDRNIFITGSFSSDTLAFDSYTLINKGYSDIFTAKYNTNGGFIWAKSEGGTALEWGNSISVDKLGNAYVTGYSESEVITFGNTTYFNFSLLNNIFIINYDSLGYIQWSKGADKSSGNNSGICIDIDKNFNIYTAGNFQGSNIEFEDYNLINRNNDNDFTDIFILKYSGGILLNTKKDISNSITYFPNPSQGSLCILSLNKIDEITISDLSGKLIYYSQPNEKCDSMLIKQEGFYIATVRSGNSTIIRKIIVRQ